MIFDYYFNRLILLHSWKSLLWSVWRNAKIEIIALKLCVCSPKKLQCRSLCFNTVYISIIDNSASLENLTTHITITKTQPEAEPKKTKGKKCTCGSNTKNTFACIDSECPCFDNLIPCWADKECECYNCNNKYGPRIMVRPKKKPCKCKPGQKLVFFSSSQTQQLWVKVRQK